MKGDLQESWRTASEIIDREPSRLFRHLFEVRHGWAIRHTFYEAQARFATREAGTFELLAAACRDLGLAAADSDYTRKGP